MDVLMGLDLNLLELSLLCLDQLHTYKLGYPKKIKVDKQNDTRKTVNVCF